MQLFQVLIPGTTIVDGQTSHPQSATMETMAEARRHPSYQVFASQMVLPRIGILGRRGISIGDHGKLDFDRVEMLEPAEKLAIAQAVGVPVEVFAALVQKLAADPQLSGEELGRQFQTALIDYEYLLEKWTKYNPPEAGMEVKMNALKLLRTGELPKAWQMFIDLPRPKAPSNLHILGNNG